LLSIVDSKILATDTDDSNGYMLFQATPKLSEDKVRQCVDTRLGGEYPPKAVAKVLTVI